MAGLPDQRNGIAAPNGSGAHLRATLRSLHPVGIAGEDDLHAPDLNLKVEAISREGAAREGMAASAGRAHPEAAGALQPKAVATARAAPRSPLDERAEARAGSARKGTPAI